MIKYRFASLCFLVGGFTAALVIGCGGSGNYGAEANQLAYSPSLSPVTNDSGRSVSTWLYLSRNYGEVRVWGDTGVDEMPNALVQVAVGSRAKGSSPARVLFDADGLPATVSAGDGGAMLAFTWQPDKALVRVYDANGTITGAATLTPTGGGIDVQPEPGASGELVGTYDLTLPGLGTGVMSLTVQGPPAGAVRGCGDRGLPSGLSRGILGDHRTEWLQRLDGTTLAPLQRGVVAAVLSAAMPDEWGRSDLANRIVSAALGGSVTAPFKDSVLPFSRALMGVHDLVTDVHDTNADWASLDATARDLRFPMRTSVFDGSSYLVSTELPELRKEDDPNYVSGIAYSDTFSVVPISGTIDSKGTFRATGNTDGKGAFSVAGQINAAAGAVSASWSLPATGQSGECTGVKGQEQTCDSEQVSGGQGGTIRTHVMGQACGTVDFTYECYTIPDRMDVYQGAQLLFSTGGLVSGGTTVPLTLVPGQGTTLRVVVTAPNSGTAWDYNIGCPNRGVRLFKPRRVKSDPEKG